METKYCNRCGEIKPITEFYKNKSSNDGHAFYCAQCHRKYGKDYRIRKKKDPVFIYKQIKSRQEFVSKHPNIYRRTTSKPVTITEDEFVEWYNTSPKKCAYCDLDEDDLVNVDDNCINKADRLTVDCVDNEIGYAVGNIVLCCARCNFIKSDFLNFDQMRIIGQDMIKPVWEKQLNKKI